MKGTKPAPSVLVVDDDPGTRFLIQNQLLNDNFSVHEAADGQAAIESFVEHRPDLILMDVEMPGINGYQACRTIRKSRAGKNLPIVMVTGLEDSQSIDRAYEVGATDFISKPMNLNLLSHRLKYILRNAGNVQALEASEFENRALLAAIPDNIFLLTQDGQIIRDLSGVTAFCGSTNVTPLPWQTSDNIARCLSRLMETRKTQSIEHEIISPEGEVRFCESRFILHGNDQVLAIVRDISERKQAEARIEYLAYHDYLTGLPNSLAFKERLSVAVEDARRKQSSLAILYIDLDRFKRINDTLGHGAGDAVLGAVTKRLKRCAGIAARHVGTKLELARIGGDEFVLLIPELRNDAMANAVAKTLQDSLTKPFKHDSHEFVVTSSIGISIFPRHGDDMETLLKNADSAMYRAKESGRNSHKVYYSSMNSRALEQFDLENDLRCALANDQLEVYFQPKIDLNNLELLGAEALLRWFHPTRGEISPSVFIPVAEETGLIVKIGHWLATKIAGQIRTWRQQGIDTVPIAINVSGHEFSQGCPDKVLIRAVKKAGINPSDIEVEITESVLMSDMGSVRRALGRLRDHGFALAVDDFGTGYSSLSYLKSFPLDVLKIDRSFVGDLENSTDSRAISKGIIALAHSLSLKVVAEGVESTEQLQFLREEGCDIAQGLLLGQPVNSSVFTRVLSDGTTALDETVRTTHLEEGTASMIHKVMYFPEVNSEVA